jgi:hypothetical protein
MKVFPADNVDIDTMLSELEHANAIRQYESGGRSYGAIRNFRKHQRPKTPNDIHPAPDDIRNYVGLASPISETFPQNGENAPQMEDGGCRMKGKEEEKKEGGAAAAEKTTNYAFSGRTIRLNQADFDNWRSRFHAIPDMAAELTALDAWLGKQTDEKRKSWFHQVPGRCLSVMIDADGYCFFATIAGTREDLVELKTPHKDWLGDRGIDPVLAEKFGLHTVQMEGRNWLAVPYVEHGRTVNHKYRVTSEKSAQRMDRARR